MVTLLLYHSTDPCISKGDIGASSIYIWKLFFIVIDRPS